MFSAEILFTKLELESGHPVDGVPIGGRRLHLVLGAWLFARLFLLEQLDVDGIGVEAEDDEGALQIDLARADQNDGLDVGVVEEYLLDERGHDVDDPGEAHDYGKLGIEMVHFVVLSFVNRLSGFEEYDHVEREVDNEDDDDGQSKEAEKKSGLSEKTEVHAVVETHVVDLETHELNGQ